MRINDIKDTSTDGWDTKRFILTFDTEYFEKVMQTEFWPDRIYFKQWFKPRNPRSATGNFITTSDK